MILISAGLLAAAVLFASEPAQIAGDAAEAGAANAVGTKPLMVCARDDASKRAFKREYGRAIYVSAEDVMASRGDGERWSAPRCITPTEFARLRRLMGDLKAIRVASR
ncbi:MAG: hypothetical protein K9G59_03635 [Caulobacter sp.]|nr:hypothetical protein [Caulobacter sp.]